MCKRNCKTRLIVETNYLSNSTIKPFSNPRMWRRAVREGFAKLPARASLAPAGSRRMFLI